MEPKTFSENKTNQVKSLESLLFRKMHSLGDRIDLLLVYSGLKPATDITVGNEWEEGQQPIVLNEEDIKSALKILEANGLIALNLPKEKGVIEGIDEGEINPSVKYRYEQSEIFVAKDKVTAETLKTAKFKKDDETYGRLSGFPESAIKAYSEADKNPAALIEDSDLPEEIRNQDFMAFATFKLSRKNWREELETAKKWATVIKKTDPALYEEAVKIYKEIISIA
ncbi:MAG: hypothetical protein WC475_02595 [Candidatus Paceibacterota bacterium]